MLTERRRATGRSKDSVGRLGGVVGVLALLLIPQAGLRAVDFLRGDANSDGEVSISDAYFSIGFLFSGGALPECGDAADANGDGTINISDPVRTLNFLVGGGPPPAAPFPEAGPRTGPELRVPCDSYGNGTPLEDPVAALAIARAEADGGGSRNASLTLSVSSSGALGGLYAEIVDEAGVIESATSKTQDQSGSGDVFYLLARLEDGVVTVGFVTSLFAQSVIPPGTDADVLTIEMCLRAGTAAGEYPLTIRAAELIAAGCDENGCRQRTGRAIHPAVTHGMLIVPADVSSEADCEDRRPPPPHRVPLVDDPPPPPRIPPGLDLAAEIRIGSAEARPGEAVELPYIVNSTGGVQGFSFSIDFDEEVLEATGIEERFIPPDPLAFPFWVSAFNNENETPGNAGIDEGYVVGGGIPDLHGLRGTLPPDVDSTPVVFHFIVNPETTARSTTLRFLDGGRVQPNTPGVENNITAFGVSVEAKDFESIVLINGLLNILPDVSAFFLRGDANGDREVNITDPQFTLGYLFRSTARPPCMDAADANDDGSVNVSDPITTLQLLFSGRTRLPRPFDAPGLDPTLDPLGCEESTR